MAPLAAQVVSSNVDSGSVSRIESENFFGISEGKQYDISFKQASLREVLQFLAWIGNVNIVIPEGIEGVVNVNFKKITVSNALNAIARANTLEYTVEGGVIRIGKLDAFKDSGEDLKTETFRLKYAPAMDMLPKIQQLLSSRGSAVADDRTNSIVIRELISNLDNLRRFIDDVDVRDAQVLIESKILTATRSFSRSIGIQWGANRGADGSSFRFGGVEAVGQADSERNLNVNVAPEAPTSGLLIGALFKGVNLDVQLLAAEQRGDVYIISDPSVVTSNGRGANIRSGTKLLVQSSSTVNIGTAAQTAAGTGTTAGQSGLQEIKTGVELTVTPQITIDDYVKMQINATTSQPDYTRAVQGIPVINDHTATTTVLVKDGETTVIGGLSKFSTNVSKKEVPYLNQIPVFGNLFKSKSKIAENSDLMVFIKPTIVRVAGTLPVQMRVREVEELKDSMKMDPTYDPVKEKKEKEAAQEKLEKRLEARKGNKYTRGGNK